jgi:hypothetical protein
MYESKTHPPIPRSQFAKRVVLHGVVVLAVIAFSLGLGMAGYGYFEGLAWRDAFLNAAMLMGGMGPVEIPRSNAGKLFAGLYALYAGLVFLVAAGVMFSPILHRILHKFHWEGDR